MTMPGVPCGLHRAAQGAPRPRRRARGSATTCATSRASRRSSPRLISSSRRYGPSKRPCAHALPGAEPSETAPLDRRIRAEIDRRRSTSSASPSQPVMSMQPPVRPRRRRYESNADFLKPSMPDIASEMRVSSGSERRVTSGSASACASLRIDLGAGLEVLGHPALVALLSRRGPDADGDVGDHAERSLRPHDDLAQGRPRGGVGRVERPERSRMGSPSRSR